MTPDPIGPPIKKRITITPKIQITNKFDGEQVTYCIHIEGDQIPINIDDIILSENWASPRLEPASTGQVITITTTTPNTTGTDRELIISIDKEEFYGPATLTQKG